MKNDPNIKACFGLSDIGVKRVNNEDVFAFLLEYGFFALADGMGGHKAGEIAAKEAISYVCSSIKEILIQSNSESKIEQLSYHLKKLYENANDWIYRLSKTNENLTGMGTTLCSALFLKNKILFSHIGDSRIYCLRDSTLHLITKDHSVMVPIKNKPTKTRKILTQVIGTAKLVNPQIGLFEQQEHDLFLICSDGLTDYVKKGYIEIILKSQFTIEKKANLLIETAKNQGSTDNITVLLIQT